MLAPVNETQSGLGAKKRGCYDSARFGCAATNPEYFINILMVRTQTDVDVPATYAF
jgi:hypothetical protein